MPRPGQVLGLVGTNGIGKSTALKILAGKLKPNLGRFASPPDWEEILSHFRGSELQVSSSSGNSNSSSSSSHANYAPAAAVACHLPLKTIAAAAGAVCTVIVSLLMVCVLCCVQNYFTRVLEDDIKAVIKPQYVDHIPKAVRGNVEEVLDGKDQRGIKQYLLDHLDLTQVGQAGSRGEGGEAW
jgi:translation initiation factor RLI1